MPQITLPDGSVRTYPDAVTVMDVAADIGPGLAKATLAGVVDGTLVDASHSIASDATLAVVTTKSDEALPLIRHSCAHLMAQAVKQLYPDTQVTIGPVIEDGFFYDFARETPFTPEDLERIETRMKELVKTGDEVERSVMARDEAVAFFKDMGEDYKQEEAPGMVFWHPRGWAIYRAVESHMREAQRAKGYEEIRTPQIVDMSLWERSGHADKFGDDMFSVKTEDRTYAVKPMNCPCHVQVFNQGLKSYRDLPLRLAEFGSCHRNEMSGALHGIMRVRGFVQDDGHIFCADDDIQSEVASFIDFLHEIYADFGFSEVIYRLSTRPPKRVGSDEDWDRSEKALADALDAKGLPWELLPGEGAFYGPKIEFSLRDCIGRVWQCGTMQVDFSMPGRLDASYVDESGERRVPVMLHRAILGSFERFIGILIEHYEGKLPLWLSPVQIAVLNITSRQAEYVAEAAKVLQDAGFRVEADLRNEKIGFKIREWTLQRASYLLVAGNREAEDGTLAVRTRDGKDLGVISLGDIIGKLNDEVARRGRDVSEE